MLQKERPNAPVVHVVGDRESDLRHVGRGGRLVSGDSHQLAAEPRRQRRVAGPVEAAQLLRHAIGDRRTEAEESQVKVVRRHLLVHPAYRLGVLEAQRPDLDLGSVGEQGVRGLSKLSHALSVQRPPAQISGQRSPAAGTFGPPRGKRLRRS